MKHLNIILVIVVIFLLATVLWFFEIRVFWANQNELAKQIISSQQAVISSNQKLELSLNDLRKQISDIGSQLPAR